MKQTYVNLLCALLFFFVSIETSHALTQAEPEILTSPPLVIQGDPIMITITNTSKLSSIKKITVDAKEVRPFMYLSSPTVLIGSDLRGKTGKHSVIVLFHDGKILTQTFTINKRDTLEVPFTIPPALGGNTKASQKKLVSTLSKENSLLDRLESNKKILWSKKFIFPLTDVTVVDPYGYSRKTGEYTITHRGTDFRAPDDTSVLAMNRGVIRLVRKSPVYGNMVVIDHGLGVMTFYLHLSKILVQQGTVVEQSQVLGLSGHTGYALGPHLHLSVRVNNLSIDPMKFMDLFTTLPATSTER